MRLRKIYVLGLAIVAVLTLCSVGAKAQASDTTDTAAVVVAPVYTGHETNKIDSAVSIVNSISDPEIKSLLSTVVNDAKNVPSGSDPWTWVAYVTALVGAAFGAYHYLKAKYYPDKPATPSKTT